MAAGITAGSFFSYFSTMRAARFFLYCLPLLPQGPMTVSYTYCLISTEWLLTMK
jgi:hypothetical protein